MRYRKLQVQPPITYEQAELINQFRVLMSKMAYLSRFYIVAKLTGVGSIDATLAAFEELPEEARALIKRISGTESDFTPISAAYMAGLQNLVNAMLSGDEAAADDSILQLYGIANENARYLAEINPYWDENRWRSIFHRYITTLVAEVLAIQNGDFDSALNAFRSLMSNAWEQGDYYAMGLFPFLGEKQEVMPVAYFNMIQDFRKIYTEWAYLMRFYIVSEISGLSNTEYVAQRLHALPSGMKGKFELVLGSEIATEISEDLLIYLMKMVGLVNTIMHGEPADAEALLQDGYRYAAQMATYLSSVNPYWDEEEGQALFSELIDLVAQESYDFQRSDAPAAMATFEKLLYLSLQIADFFARGLYLYTLIDAEQRPQGETME